MAATAHEGQKDKAGEPYILHPLRVMNAVTTDFERLAGVLHDVVEDTSLTFDDLVASGVPTPVVEAIRALTKTEGESRIAAAARAASDGIAMNVKLADVRDNMDMSRLKRPSAKDRARLDEYREVERLLLARGARLSTME